MKKKIIFFGGNSWGIHILDHLLYNGYEVPLVVAPPGISAQKSAELRDSLPPSTITVKGCDFRGETIADIIKSIKDYLILACSYTAIIPKSIVNLGVVNIHGAILPYHRGANMLNWAIINGWKETGITLHYMEETLDSGNIIGNIAYPIYSYETVNDVKATMFAKTYELLDKHLPVLMSGNVKGSKQDHTLAKYYPKRKPEDGKIDWSKNAIDVYNLVRALVRPYPGAFFYHQHGNDIADKVRIETDNCPHFKPGKIIRIDDGIWVTTGYNIIVIEEIRNFDMKEVNSFYQIGDCLE